VHRSSRYRLGTPVHRRKTQFAQRVNRYATALERRGIRATYALHDKLLSNHAARRKLSQDAPTLDPLQQRLVESLRTEGHAVISFSELFPDPATWQALDEESGRFVADSVEGLAREQAGLESGLRRTGKEFVVRRNAYGATVRADDAWLSVCTDRRLLDLVNSYLGLWSKLEYLDLWYTAPHGDDAERRGSQRWHRDFDDRYLLKVFVYLVDVDEQTGPFQYVPGSQPGGRYDHLLPWRPMGESYPPDEEVISELEAAAKTLTGPKGTMFLCNTSGFHRGGYVTQTPRVLATATYCSPASLASLTERNFSLEDGAVPFDAPVRYALG
jgi:Phytanoyl-CoA dioxygenase (PhyH)